MRSACKTAFLNLRYSLAVTTASEKSDNFTHGNRNQDIISTSSVFSSLNSNTGEKDLTRRISRYVYSTNKRKEVIVAHLNLNNASPEPPNSTTIKQISIVRQIFAYHFFFTRSYYATSTRRNKRNERRTVVVDVSFFAFKSGCASSNRTYTCCDSV